MRSRNRRRLQLVAVLVALYALLGFFGLPPLIKWQLEKRLPEELGRPVTIGRVRVNPFALSLGLERVTVRARDGSDTFLGWNRLHVNFDAIGSITDHWSLDELSLEDLRATVVVRPDGSLNFSDLIEKYRTPADADPKNAEPSRPWRVRRLNVASAAVAFADHSQADPFRTEFGPVNFTVMDFRTAGLRGAPGRFEAVTESGEKFTWIGSLTAAPLTSSGDLRIENLALPKYAPYLVEFVRADVASGQLALDASYELDLSPQTRRVVLKSGAVELKDLRVLQAGGGQALIELGVFAVSGIAGDALAAKVAVDQVRLQGGRVIATRSGDGSIDLLSLLVPRETTTGENAPRPDVNVREIAVQGVQVQWRDESTPRPAELSFTDVNATLRNFTLAPATAMPVELSLEWSPRGTLSASGNLTVNPLLADLDVKAANIALPPVSPYAEQFAQLGIASGTATLNGHVRVALAEDRPDLTFTG
ncbi:MAG TPA: DUF748 domain-containing protein, partial [Opitutus sp.]|nr:DUF748 domain-containing protein [Opitutus sp.]